MGLRRSRLERGAGRRCLQTGSGCSRCLERTWSCCRPGLARRSRCRRETWCGSETVAWLGDSKRIVFTGYSGDNTPRGYIQEIPAGTSSRDNAAGSGSRRQSGGARRELRPRPRRRHVGALSDSRRGWPARSSAHAWRYPASMEPWRPIRVHRRQRRWGAGRQPLMSFAWSWRPAAGLSGKLSRRPTPWGSRTCEKQWSSPRTRSRTATPTCDGSATCSWSRG